MQRYRTPLLLLTALTCATVAQAQSSLTSGALKGTVRVKGAGVVASATVTIRNQETGLSRTTSTNTQGEFTFSLLPIGPYDVTVQAKGMSSVKDSSLRVSLGQATTSTFTLDKAEAAATVVVLGSAQGLDATQVNTLTTIDEKMVQGIPLNGRNFTDLVRMTPGAVTDPTTPGRQLMEGGRGIMNNLTIDGASYNSNFYGEQRGGVAIPFAFGLDTIKELQVIQDAFDPQYGDAVGGIINAVSKTGTNDFAGSLLMQFRPSSLVALMKPVPQPTSATTNTTASRTREFSQKQYNFTFGGPIIKDKLHFFLGLETQTYSQNSTTAFQNQGATGNNSLTQFGTFMTNFGNIPVGANGHTLASENGLGVINDKKNTTVFARLDWTINEDHRFNFRVNTQKFTNENGTFPVGSIGQSGNYTDDISSISWVAELTSLLSPNMTNEARLQIGTERRPRASASMATPEIIVSGGGFTGFSAGQYWASPSGLNEFSKQLIDNLTYTKGDWTFKAGADLQWFHYQNLFPQYLGGYFQFNDYATANAWKTGTLTAANTVSYKGSISPTGGWIDYSSRRFGGYLQAQYSGLLDHRLTLTGGFRATKEDQADNPRPNAQLVGLDAPNSSTAIDPRIGFTYDLDGKGTTMLRGGYGWFSSPNPSLTVSNTMTSNGKTISVYTITQSQLAAWNSGVLSYANRTAGGTTLTKLDQPSLLGLVTAAPTLTGQLWDPDNKLFKAKRASLGLEHKLPNAVVLGVRLAYADFENEQYFRDINLWQKNADGTINPNGYYNDGYATTLNSFTNKIGAGVTTARPGFAIVRGRRVDLTGFGDVFLSQNAGKGNYKAFMLTAARQSDSGFGFQSSLSFASAKDINSNERNTNGLSAASNSNNPADPQANLAPGDYDAKFRGVFAGYFPIYWGVRGMAMVTYQTGLPFSTIASSDLNGDGGTNDYAPGYGGRNAQRQPATKSSSLRFTRAWKLASKLEVEANIDIYNVLNWANFSTNQTTAGSATYGYLNTLDQNTREMQFGVRVKF